MMSNNFWHQPFVAVSENLGGKVPVVDDVLLAHEQIYATTSLVENCIGFEFETDRNYYVDLRPSYLALKLEFVNRGGYETYNSKEVKQNNKGKAKADESVEEEDEFLSLVM